MHTSFVVTDRKSNEFYFIQSLYFAIHIIEMNGKRSESHRLKEQKRLAPIDTHRGYLLEGYYSSIFFYSSTKPIQTTCVHLRYRRLHKNGIVFLNFKPHDDINRWIATSDIAWKQVYRMRWSLCAQCTAERTYGVLRKLVTCFASIVCPMCKRSLCSLH